MHAVATTPAGPMNSFARTVPSASAFPEVQLGRLLHCPFRGLLSVHSRYGLHAHRVAMRPFPEGFSSFVTSTAASVVTGRNEPAPGRDFHPLLTSAFPRRTGPCGQRGALEIQYGRFHGGFSMAKALLMRGQSDRLARSPHGVRQPTQRWTLF